MLNKKEILDKLFSLHRFGIKPGLERTLALLEMCDNPHLKIKTIHVAGTNGKGSICSLIASTLMESGLTTGLYTSPHLFDFNERITINGQMISDDELIEISSEVIEKAESISATFFEITTVIAFEYFARKNVDIVVVETGMGGRFDSTNVIIPLVSVISSISIDHTNYLGDTIDKIAYEKAGIIKKNIPVVIADNTDEVFNIIKNKALDQNSELFFAPELFDTHNIKFNSDFTMTFDLTTKNETIQIKTALAGKHQIDNHLAALTAISILRNHFLINDNHIINGIRKVKDNCGLKARIEVIDYAQPIIIDVAHNPSAFAHLMDTLIECSKAEKWNIIFAAMNDKDYSESLKIIKDYTNKLIISKPHIERAETLDKLYDNALKLGFNDIIKIENPEEAFAFGAKLNFPLLAAGSFYLLSDMPQLKLIRKS